MTNAAKKTLIHCERLGIQFNGIAVLQDINLTLSQGDRIALLGPSGCGKSTLLNVLAGLLEASTGTVERYLQPAEMSFVFQDASLLPWKTVLQNITMIPELIAEKINSAELYQRAESILLQVGLQDKLNAYPDQLSGGMKMRAALARALLVAPQLLLLDEPFSALDDPTRERLQDDLRAMHASSSLTTVLVTHNMEEAFLLADRIFVFSHDGRILREFQVAEYTSGEVVTRESAALSQMRSDVRTLWQTDGLELHNA